MTELERQLQTLAPYVELPAEPELAAAVRARIAARRPSRFGRAVALGLAVVAIAIGVAFAVPPARSAILRFFGFGGVRIEFVDRLPAVPVTNTLDLGQRTTLAGAPASVSYRVLTSNLLGRPNEVWLRGDQVGFVYRDGAGIRLLVTQFPGREQPQFVKKLIEPGTQIRGITVDGSPGFWITGAPHGFLYLDNRGRVVQKSIYLAGNTLLLQRGKLVLRLEGKLTLAQAIRASRSFD
jgi:hypothetical protein